jgi:Kef-type K+ transport system membrane component KefB/voltage-gated potassium channel Kch
MEELVKDITLATLMAWLLGVAAHLIRQPLILAYIAGGLLLGPSGLQWVKSQESIATIAELGLIFMLFMIGLEIDLKKIARAGPVILVTAAVQIVAGCILGIAVFAQPWLGTDGPWDALYLAVAAALSSTVIIVKVLYDKRELDTHAGRVTLGVLVLQDLFAILFLAVQPSLDALQFRVVLLSIGRVFVLVAAALAVSRFILPFLFHRIARLPELVLVGAVAWCFAVAELAEALHLSREMGALIAGVALSTFPYALDVTAKVTTLRDFFITLFFVALGMTIPLPTLPVIGLALVLAVFTIVTRTVTVFLPLYVMKQGLRASLLPSFNLSQISEFSLVLVQIGFTSKHVSDDVAGACSLAFVILAVVSTFVMTRSDPVSRVLIRWLKRMGLRDLDHQQVSSAEGHGDEPAPPIVVLGFYRTASAFLWELERRDSSALKQVCVVDFNPHVYQTLTQSGVKVYYGDVSHSQTLAHAGLENAKIVISTVPDSLLMGTSNEKLVRLVHAINPEAKIVATAETLGEVGKLYAAGAEYVLVARMLEANELLEVVGAIEAGLIEDKRSELNARLKDRREVLP